jgi:Phage integrase, N-terminal SAM-like domain
MSNHPPKLLDRVSAALRARHYSRRTDEAYVMWIKRYNKKHPSSMGGEEVNAFLTSLGVDDHVSASTQNQALSALLFLYREVLSDPLPRVDDLIRANRASCRAAASRFMGGNGVPLRSPPSSCRSGSARAASALC